MTPHASTAPWQPPVRASKLLLAFTVLGGAIVGIIATLYLSGYVFLLLIKADPRAATPLTVVRYGYYYGGREDIRLRLWVSSAVGLTLVLAPGLALLLPKRRSLHGNARFARGSEMARAGLFADEGIVLGRTGGWGPFGGRFLILGGQLGASLTAQPRAGKGVSVVVPTLLSYCESIVCTDIKKENWAITAGFRRSIGQEVHLFDPLSRRTKRWNPYDYVSDDPGQRISDLQLIANMFIPDPPGADPFWASGGRTLMLGIALYLFATPSLPRTIGETLRQGMANDEEGFSQHWKRVIEGRQRGRHPLPDVCVRALSEVIDLAPQTASSIRRTFTAKLELWLNPILDAATAASDFDLRDLRKRAMSIYLGVMPKDLERLTPLLSLFFQQAIALQTDTLPEHDRTLKHQVLMLLDEFPALGPLPILSKSAGFLPGYNVRTLMIMQSQSQLRDVYGIDRAKTLLKTIAARVHFAPKDMEDAEEISNELGNTTVKIKSVSKPAFSLFDRGRRQASVSVSEQKRPLMLPQEIKEMGVQRQIIFAENVRPIYCKKIHYYLMPVFLARLRPPPKVPYVDPVTPSPSGRITSAQTATSNPEAGATVEAQQPWTPRSSVDTLIVETPKTKTRAATAADIERIDELTLEDFAVDFDNVVLPSKAQGERMTAQELDTAVESFIAALQEAPGSGPGGL